MRIRVEECCVDDSDDVEVTIYLGRGDTEPVLAGAIRTDLDVWLELLARIEAPYYRIDRAACATCGCPGHLGDVCLAAVIDASGATVACRCGAFDAEPETTGDGRAVLDELERARERAS